MWNNTSQVELESEHFHIYHLFDVIVIVECLIAMVFNLIVVHVICNHKSLWTRSNQLVLCNAISSASAVVLIPPEATLIIFRGLQLKQQWELTCRVLFALTTAPTRVICLTLTAMACERSYATCFPLKARMYITIRKMQLTSLFIWVIVLTGVVFVLYFVVSNQEEFDDFQWSCSQGYV